MSIETDLATRSEKKCELCGATENLGVYEVTPKTADSAETCIQACATCSNQIEDASTTDAHHWRCLNDSMWSQVPAVQVVAWRMLKRLSASEDWALDLLNMMYLDEETQSWAQAGIEDEEATDELSVKHVDRNGVILASGDTVTLIKDLTVKGAGFTAKRGTAVTNISLVPDNAAHIEGRVNGMQIVILTEFVKKS